MNKSKLALMDNENFPIDMIEEISNIRDVSEKDLELKELAKSIETYGQLEPIGIGIETDPKTGKFPLIYGHRRFKAISKILKWKSIKVVQLTPGGREETQLVENIHRKDLTDYEIAKTLYQIKTKTKKKNKDLVKIVNKSIDWIESKLKHYQIIESINLDNSETSRKIKNLSTDKVKPVSSLPDNKKQKLLEETVSKNKSVKEIREQVKSETSRKDNKPIKPKTPLEEMIEEKKKLEIERVELSREITKLENKKFKIEDEINRLETKIRVLSK